MDRILTLIGVKLAKKNRKFIFSGALPECENCDPSLKSVCLNNLEKGRMYEIIDIRNIIHPCAVHEGGVTVVEVQKAPIKTALDARKVYEGTTISFQYLDCDETSCKNYIFCKPKGIKENVKYKITQIFGNLPHICEKGKRLKLVELKG